MKGCDFSETEMISNLKEKPRKNIKNDNFIPFVWMNSINRG